MKYLSKFETVAEYDAAKNSLDLPHVSLISATMGVMYDPSAPPPVGPSANELWYTSSDGNIVTPYRTSSLPEIDTNTYSDGKGVIKFKTNVTTIGEWAFWSRNHLTSITIPNSVTSIGVAAFASCSSLTSVTIPNSVTSIGNSAFHDCSGLTSINVASDNSNYCSVDGIVFNKNRTTLVSYPGGKQGAYFIPNSVTSIGDGAFAYCSGLTSVTIPNSVTSIEESAFALCRGLTSVTIPNSVTSIGDTAFINCSGLTSVTIPNSVTNIGDSAFESCIGLTSIEIPDSVINIEDYAFFNCTNLTSVTIGNNVTSIGGSAFFMGDDTTGEPEYLGSLQTITVVDGQTYNYNGEEEFTIALANGTDVTLSMWLKEEEEEE